MSNNLDKPCASSTPASQSTHSFLVCAGLVARADDDIIAGRPQRHQPVRTAEQWMLESIGCWSGGITGVQLKVSAVYASQAG